MPGLNVDFHRRAADALDLGVDLEHVADPHRPNECHRIDCDGDDAAFRALDTGNAPGLVHPRQHPAAENIAVGVGVGGHGGDADGELAAGAAVGGGGGGHEQVSANNLA